MALASWFVFRGNLRERFGKPKGKPGDVRMPSQPISIDDFLRRLRDIESDRTSQKARRRTACDVLMDDVLKHRWTTENDRELAQKIVSRIELLRIQLMG